MIIAQITDLHVRATPTSAFGGLDTGARLASVVAAILSLDMRPDVVVVTGDLVDDGTAAEYDRLRDLLSPLPMPVFPVPGNHDNRENLLHAFPNLRGRMETPFVQYAVDDHPVRLIGLDTSEPGHIGGVLCEERLDHAALMIATSRKPTLVFMHHPPFDVGLVHNPDLSCTNADRLAAHIRQNTNLQAIVCGHVHRTTTSRLAQAPAIIAPSVSPALELAASGVLPGRWLPSEPAFMLHLWNAQAKLVSVVCGSSEAVQVSPFSG